MKRLALIALMFLAGCTPTLPSGKVVAKTYVPSSFGYVSSGNGGFSYTPEKWVIVISGRVDGEYITNTLEVSPQTFESVNVGDNFTRY